MVYLVNLDQRNLLEKKGISYTVKPTHVCWREDARQVTHVILMSLEE